MKGKCIDMYDSETKKDVYKECDGACLKLSEKCNGKCGFYQCESENGKCLNSVFDNLSVYSCNGKCIPKQNPCNGECYNSQYQCLLDGKCIDHYQDGEYVWNNCDGACINVTEKCNGECSLDACESDEGLCVDYFSRNSPMKSCDGKCIDWQTPCKGECVSYLDLCERNGKCLDIYDDKTREQVWQHCGNKCVKMSEKCEGTCHDSMCEKDGKCIKKEKHFEFEDCDGKCMKKGEKCNGKCRYNECETEKGSCKDMFGNGYNLMHGKCKEKCIQLEANNSTKPCEGKCPRIWGLQHVLVDGRCYYHKMGTWIKTEGTLVDDA